MYQEEFNNIVKLLTTKIKPGEEWNIDLSQELRKYQEYALCSDFGGTTNNNSSEKLHGSFMEAGLVLENASQIYGMRVDDAFETTINCAQSLRRCLLNSDSCDKKAKTSQIAQNDHESPKPQKNKPVENKSKKSPPKADTAYKSSFSYNLFDQINQVSIKVDPSQRRILEEPYRCTKVIPPYIQFCENTDKENPITNPVRNNNGVATNFKCDYMINTDIASECYDEDEDEEDEDKIVETEEMTEEQSLDIDKHNRSSSPSITDSGFDSSSYTSSSCSSDGQDFLSSPTNDLDVCMKNLYTAPLMPIEPNFAAIQDDIDSLIRHANSIQKQIVPLLHMTPKQKAILKPTLEGTDLFITSAIMEQQVNKVIEQQLLTEKIIQQVLENGVQDSVMKTIEQLKLAQTIERGAVNEIRKQEEVIKSTNQESLAKVIEEQEKDKLEKPQAVDATGQRDAEILTSQYNIFKLPASLMTVQMEFELPYMLRSKCGFFELPLNCLQKEIAFNLPKCIKPTTLKRSHSQSNNQPTPGKVARTGKIEKSTHASNKTKRSATVVRASEVFDEIDTELGNEADEANRSLENTSLTEAQITDTSTGNKTKASATVVQASEVFDEIELDITTELRNEASENPLANSSLLNTPLTGAPLTNTPAVLNERSFDDDYEDEGFSSPGSEFSNDYNDMPETPNSNVYLDKDCLRESITPLKEVLPTLEKVSMLKRMSEDLTAMADRPPSPDTNNEYETFTDECGFGLPYKNTSTPKSTKKSSATPSELSDSVSTTPKKKGDEQTETLDENSPLSRQKNLREMYRIEDPDMDKDLQQWATMIKPKIAYDQENKYKLAKYKKLLVNQMSKINKKHCTLHELLLMNDSTDVGRFLLAGLQLTNENKLRIVDAKTGGIGNPRSISLKFHNGFPIS